MRWLAPTPACFRPLGGERVEHGRKSRVIGRVAGAVVPQDLATVHEERARHLHFVTCGFADQVALAQGDQPAPPDGWTDYL